MSIEKPTIEAKSEFSTFEKEPILVEYFPTTVEQARDGVRKFLEAQEKSSVFRKATAEDPDLLHAIAGLKPEIGFYWNAGFDKAETAEEKNELLKTYEEICGMKVLVWKTDQGETAYSLLNPESVARVIRNCPIEGLFPEEAVKNPMGWVTQNPKKWFERTGTYEDPRNSEVKKTISRFGILSGYPPHGSSMFPEYIIVDDVFLDKKLTKNERVAYNRYIHADRKARKFPKSIEKKLSTAVAVEEVTAEQADLVRKRFQFHDLWSKFGSGFSDKDEEYFKQIQHIGSETGIDVTYSNDFFTMKKGDTPKW